MNNKNLVKKKIVLQYLYQFDISYKLIFWNVFLFLYKDTNPERIELIDGFTFALNI